MDDEIAEVINHVIIHPPNVICSFDSVSMSACFLLFPFVLLTNADNTTKWTLKKIIGPNR